MALHNLVGLHVENDNEYQQYRDRMTPILKEYGGYFSLDLTVDQLLKAPTDIQINRLFILTFPDSEASKSFFQDPAYLEVRKAHFEPSVRGVARLAQYEGDEQ